MEFYSIQSCSLFLRFTKEVLCGSFKNLNAGLFLKQECKSDCSIIFE